MTVVISDPTKRIGREVTCACGKISSGAELVYVIARNQAQQFRFRCMHCKQVFNHNVSHSLLPEKGDATLLADYSDAAQGTLPFTEGDQSKRTCARCGSTVEVELHHYAPQAIFGDAAYEFATGFLCRSCHIYWHQTVEGYYRRR